MDRAFLTYYEEELTHIRALASEFSALHPTVARNLSLDAVPSPDPYVERLLEGVAFLAARTRLKVDAESGRYVKNLLDALYPDLVGPAPAMTMAQIAPGPQVETMLGGHVVPRGTRLLAGLREGLATRATFTTAQDVMLWPVRVETADYLQDAGALKSAGLTDAQIGRAEAGLRIVVGRSGAGAMADLALDRLDLYLGAPSRGGPLFDAIHGAVRRTLAREARSTRGFAETGPPRMVGIGDREALLPRVRPAFEGYRLLREYFLLPERFQYVRLEGLGPTVATCADGPLEVVLLLDRARPEIADASAGDFTLFVTPLVNLFERECNIVELDRRRFQHIVHADRSRPRDFEIYRLLRVEDADAEGPEARITPLYGPERTGGGGHAYATERRLRRPGEDEIRRGQTRTGYAGDDLFVSVCRTSGGRSTAQVRRLDIRALCTNRDLPILDDTPTLTLESGDPVREVRLLSAFRRPRPSLMSHLPRGAGSEERADDLAWRLVAQLSLDHLSLAEEARDAEPLRALLDLYADRGDPALARHGTAVRKVSSEAVVERLGIAGPICFAHGTRLTLHVDEALLSGGSSLLLSALLAQLFARHAAINSFVRTRTRLMQRQEDVEWPTMPGNRTLI